MNQESSTSKPETRDLISLFKLGDQMLSEKYGVPGLFELADMYIQQRCKEEGIKCNISVFDILEKKMCVSQDFSSSSDSN